MSTLRELQSAIEDGAIVELRVPVLQHAFEFVQKESDGQYEYLINGEVTESFADFDSLVASVDWNVPQRYDWRVKAPVGLTYPELEYLRRKYEGWWEAWRIQCLAGEWKA